MTFDCRRLSGASDVLLVIKTGATELFSKLPTHLLTTLTCVPDYLIFSDMDQFVGSLEIHDALASISDKWKIEDQYLSTLYPKLKEYQNKGLDLTDLSMEGAWELDKWKNVPMAIEAYKKYPDKKWFVFIDADSAILWSNLLLWLEKQDPNQRLYFGSPVYIGFTTFAHGGSGYVLSAAAAKMLVELEPENKEHWEKRTSEVCCGDQMLAEALQSGGVEITNLNPVIHGLTPRSVDYDEWHWCKAPVTWHHVTPAEVEELWTWEQDWLKEKGREVPILYSDLFYYYAGQQLITTVDPVTGAPLTSPERNRTNWDNLSGGREFIVTEEELASNVVGPFSSAEDCKNMCASQAECLQWKWRPGKCRLGHLPCLGRKPFAHWDRGNQDNTRDLTSGWMEEKIREYVEKLGECDMDRALNVQ
ncbi:hypothetical protein NA57DRAFT_62699 [Rhizodiscina lignyota]|uniref:Glycosyltransferase family 31 protein n=1 Tax=Rhizodiscina lignyota TaxID=1504668 RepID=A0A9P4ILR2_9PEZI|nr:hypothetical protein NA57DRAFT_62699 [Rhizodiscina lignyota]